MIQLLKSIVIYSTMFLWGYCLYAQPKIIMVEYYIDNDPGYGNAIAISVMPGANFIDSTVKINPVNLTTGVHLLGIRAKDANGSWSLDNKWLFVKDATPADTPNIIKVEYYIDTDPGYGNAIDTAITQNANLSSLTHSINPATLSAGVHVFGIRAKDANGAWSLDNKWLFVKDVSPANVSDIVRVEYYIDIDPGYGNAIQFPIMPAPDLFDTIKNINTAALAQGVVHIFAIRAKDANGAWSLDDTLHFEIDNTVPILLSNLTGQYIHGANELTAVIQQAVNVKVVQVEKSIDGTHFTYLGDMAVAPVTSGTFNYEDKDPATGNNYYRLRIVDIDGKASYSYVILLNHTSPFVVQVYPNPVQDNLKVHFQNAVTGIYNIRVTNALGKNILSHKVNIWQNNQTGDVNISFGRYPAGTYFIEISDAFNKIISAQKIIKN